MRACGRRSRRGRSSRGRSMSVECARAALRASRRGGAAGARSAPGSCSPRRAGSALELPCEPSREARWGRRGARNLLRKAQKCAFSGARRRVSQQIRTSSVPLGGTAGGCCHAASPRGQVVETYREKHITMLFTRYSPAQRAVWAGGSRRERRRPRRAGPPKGPPRARPRRRSSRPPARASPRSDARRAQVPQRADEERERDDRPEHDHPEDERPDAAGASARGAPRARRSARRGAAGKLHHGCTIVQKSVAKKNPQAMSETESRCATSRSASRRYAAKITAEISANATPSPSSETPLQSSTDQREAGERQRKRHPDRARTCSWPTCAPRSRRAAAPRYWIRSAIADLRAGGSRGSRRAARARRRRRRRRRAEARSRDRRAARGERTRTIEHQPDAARRATRLASAAATRARTTSATFATRAVDAEERRRDEDHREAERGLARASLGARHHEGSFHDRETYAYTSFHGT